MFQERKHASDSAIAAVLDKIRAKESNPYTVAERLEDEGLEVIADGSGIVLIIGLGEKYTYPLGVTELPTRTRGTLMTQEV